MENQTRKRTSSANIPKLKNGIFGSFPKFLKKEIEEMEDDDEESYNIPKNEQEVKELEEKITAMIGPYAFGQLKLAYQEQIDITKQKVEEAKKKEIDLKEQISVLEEELSMNIERAAFLEKKIAKDKELMNSVNQKLQQLQAKDKFNFSNEEEDDSF